MLHRHSRKDLYSPFLKSNPLIQGSPHQSQNDSVQTNTNQLNSSDTYDLNQNQTQRGTLYQNDLHTIRLRKNQNQMEKISQQIHSFKLSRIPSQVKINQPYKNSSQPSTSSINLKKLHSANESIQSSQSDYDNYSQNKSRVSAINNQRNPNRNEEVQNENRITNRPKSGHLVSLGNPISFKPSPSMLSCHRDVKHSSLNQDQQSVYINNNKQNNQPNSVYSSQSEYQSNQSLNKPCVDKNHQSKQKDSLIIQNKLKTQDPLCFRNAEFIPKNKFMKSGSQLLLPAVNTESGDTHRQSDMNFRSNSIIDQSSISPLCESSRISQQDTQIGYLKQKLIQTHTKLIKQLQISKQLEDNFFSLKKKYENLICSNQNSKPSEALYKKIQQLQNQLKVQQNQFKIKEKQWEEKQIRFINNVSQLQKKQLQLLAQSEEKQVQSTNIKSQFDKKQLQWNKESISLNQKLASVKQQISQINEENAHLKHKITQINEENFHLNQEINQMNEEFENLKQEISQMNEESLRLNQEVKNYKKSMQKLLSENLSLQSKETMMHQEIDERNFLAQQNRQLVLKNQQLKTDLETMRNKVLSLNKYNEQLSDEIQQFTNSISTYSTQISHLEQRLAKKQKQYLEKEQLCQIWRKKYSDSQQDSNKNQQIIIKHQKEEKQLKNHNSQLNIALRQQKEKNAQMLSEIINIQMENKELKSKMHALQQQKQQLQDKLFEITPQKNILHQKQELELQIQKLTTQYNTLSTIINKKDKEISEIKNHLFETQSILTKLSLREKQIEKKSQQLDEWSKQLQLKQRNLQEQRLTKINSVKSFVNQLEDQKDRSVALRKTHQQINRQNRAQTPTNIQRQNILNHTNIKIDSSNGNNSRCLSPVSPLNSKIIPKNKNTCMTPSKSLNNLNVNSLSNNNFGSFKNIQTEHNSKRNHQNFIGYNQQNICSDNQSYEDSLQANNNLKTNIITNHHPQIQNEIQIQQNFTQIPIVKNKSQTFDQKYIPVTPFKQNNTAPSVRKTTKIEELKASNEEKKFLSSYKQEKEHYMRLLEEIGELELQSYNLGQQKKSILDELERIQNTKVKTKEIIGKRRQLELRLLGNEKKNNEVKEKLRGIRGKVV